MDICDAYDTDTCDARCDVMFICLYMMPNMFVMQIYMWLWDVCIVLFYMYGCTIYMRCDDDVHAPRCDVLKWMYDLMHSKMD